MSLKPYSEYKESGIDWLGRVPCHWQITRLKNSILEAKNGVWGLDPDGSELDLRCVRVADFDRPRLSIHDHNATLRKIPVHEQKGRILEKGDLLLEKSGGGEKSPVGFVVLYDHDEPAVCSNFVARLVLYPGMDSRFWTYLHSMLYSRRLTQRSIKQTTGIQNLDQASYFNELVPFPTDEEQRMIADFLDRETAEIDAFIADQERLIELLEERRAETIIQAVTKGLDLTMPTKDSGVEWIGSLPASWDIKRMSWLFGTISSGTTPPVQKSEYFDGEFNWVTTSELRETSITHTNRTITRKALREFPSLRLYGPGTLLIAMYGATIGRLGLLETTAATNQACCAFSEPIGTSSKFVFYVLLAAREHLMVLADGGGQPNINQEKLRSLRIPQPDFETQNEIVDFLDQETSALDAAVSDAREAIALSRERRAALISAAVTGQLDVSQAQSRGSAGEVLEQGVRV